MKNLLLTLLLCTSFCVQANTLPMTTGHGSVVKIDADENVGRTPESLPVMPPNDFCAGAIPITPSPAGASCTVAGFTLPFSTDGTTDSGVPDACDEPTQDQWFTWTATTDGLNFASYDDGDPGIAVFASCSDADAGQAIDCIKPLNSGVLSGWNIGDELLIQIFDFRNNSNEDLVFCLEAITVVTSDTPPVNDLCSGAIPILPSAGGTGCDVPQFLLPFASDGTTDSGVPAPGFIEPFKDQWFTWTATSDVLEFTTASPGRPGITVFANCADANAGNAIIEVPVLSDGELSGWNIGDELIIQIHGLRDSPNSDVAFCLEDPNATDEPPVARCRNQVIINLDENGAPGLIPAAFNNGSSDDFTAAEDLVLEVDPGDATIDCSAVNTLFFPQQVVTLRVTDDAGQTSSCTSTFQVRDNTTPVLVCQDVTMELDPITGINNLDTLFAGAIISATDNCAPLDTFIVLTGIGVPPISMLTCDDIGTISLMLGVRSISSSAVSCNVTITVTDPGLACDDAPIARCANDFTVELDEFGSSAAFLAEELDAGSSDTETPAADLLFSFDPAEGPLDCDDIGTSAVSLIVTDNVGQADTCFTQVTVVDDLAPEVTCQNVVIELEADQSTTLSSGLIAFVIATDFSDNCAAFPPAVTNTQTRRIECDELGVATRTFIYIDGNGQEDRCPNVRLQINDPLGVCGEDPIANCSETTVIVDNLEDGPAVVNANVFDNGSTDDRSVYTLVYSDATDRQENTTFDCSTTGVNQGQTFTAGQTGVIQSIKVRAGAASSNRLLIRDFFSPGDSVSFGGYFQDVDLFFGEYSDRANLTVINLDVPFPVTAGQEYFFRLIGETTLSRSCSGSDAYADGRPTQGDNFLNSSGDEDLTFEVNIIGPTEREFPTVGATPVTVFAVDDQGNVSEGCETFVEFGQRDPIARCSTSVIAQLDENGEIVLEPGDLDSLSLSGTPPSPLTFTFGSSLDDLDCQAAIFRTIHPVTLVVTNGSGRSASCVSQVSVQDTIPPVLVCQDVVIVPVNPETGTARFNSLAVIITSSENCGGRTFDIIDGAIFTCEDVGRSITRTLTGTDRSFNTTACEFSVMITDPENFCPPMTPPVAVCQPTLTVELDEDGNTILSPADLNNGSSDAETPAADLVFSFDPAEGPLDCDDIGTLPVSLIVTDTDGQMDTCFTLVTVTENTPPVFANCPANITVDTDPGLCFATVDFTTPTILFDPCDFPAADLTLESILARYNSNIDALLATIPNRFVLEEDFEDNNSFDDGGDDAYDTGNFMNTDFATEIEYSENVITTSDDFGTNSAYFTAYNTGVWMMAADVTDLTFYEINGELGADSDGFTYAFEGAYTFAGGATYRAFVKGVSEADDDPSVNHLILVPDAPASASQSFSNDTDDDDHRVEGLAGVTRIYQFNWYGQDADGDSFDYSNTEIDAIVQAFIRLVAEPTTVVNQTAGLSSGSLFPTGDTEVTFTATDPSGNTADCSFTVRVEDNELPQATACPTDTTLYVNADSCRLSFAFEPVQFADNCSGASILFVSDNLNGFEIPGQLTQLGFDVTTVFEDYIDEDTQDNTVLQGDLSGFDMIYWNASGETDNGDGHSQATTDNLLNYVLAGGHLFVTGFDAIASPTDPNLIALLGGSGSVDRPDTEEQIYTVLGPANSLNSGLFDITSLPIPSPGDEDGLLGLNAETTVVLDSDSGQGARWALRTTTGGQIAWVSTTNGGAGTQFSQWARPGSGYFEALRNFAFNNLRFTPFDGVQTTGPVSGSSFELGTTTLTFTGTDPSGNDAACSYNVTVLDTISPLVVCQDITIALDTDGMASLSAEDLLVPSTDMMIDNCPVSLVVDQTTFTCADVGDNTVVLTATDDSDNEGSCTATVTVTASDLACDAPPLAICLETLTIELDEDGNTDLSPADLDNGSSDAVTPTEDLIFSFDPAEGLIDCDDIGTLPVSLIVTDNDGQTDTCFTQVTVEDNIAPEAICQDVVFELRSNGRYTIVLSDILNSILTEYTDNCGALNTGGVAVSGGTNFACGAIGDNARSFTFENDDEEESLCDVTIAITDPLGVCGEDPVVICQPFTVTDVTEPTVNLNANVFDNGSTDDRSVYALVYSDETDRQENTTFDCSTTGINQGQTFIAGQTGVIQSIKVRAGAASSTRLNIRDFFFPGDSVTSGGYFQDVDLFFGEHSDRANLTVINLDVPFPVTAGQEYFFRLIGETTLSRSCPGSDAYADGRPTLGDNFFNGSGDEDLTFEVNIIGPDVAEFPSEGGTPVTVYAVDDQGKISEGCNTFVNPDQPLPVEWLSFGANAGTKTVDLQWETTEEPDNAGFHVERSAGGNNWSVIGQVDARLGADQRYDFIDNAPLNGTSYYRLRQMDFDGEFTYSPVETIEFFGDERVVLYPNPATDILSLQLPEGAEVLALLNVAGQETGISFDGPEGQLKTDVSRLPAGVYFLRVKLANAQSVARRLIIR